MPLWAPPSGLSAIEEDLPLTGAGHGVEITTGATPHVKTAYTTLLTPTFDVYRMVLSFTQSGGSATVSGGLCDIAFSSSDLVILSNLLCGWVANGPNARVYDFPIFVPSGEPIKARVQSAVATNNIFIACYVFGRPTGGVEPWTPGRVETLGITEASSVGVEQTVGNGSKSAYISIGTTHADYITRGIIVGVGGGTGDTTMLNCNVAVDIGFGGSGSQQLYHSNLLVVGNTGEECLGPYGCQGVGISLPPSTEIWARAQSHVASQDFDYAVYCLQEPA